MATENKFDKLRSMVHQGVPMEEKPAQKTGQSKKQANAVTGKVNTPTVTDTDTKTEMDRQSIEPDEKETKKSIESKVKLSESTVKPLESSVRPAEKRRRKPVADYQGLFFSRIDFTHRKPLYITATTHRRLMRIVHLMDESKATISSYVENIILNHPDTFKEEIDIIYQTNTINPTE